MNVDGLFFAIYPDVNAAASAAQSARRLRGKFGLKGGLLLTEHFHVSLQHLGLYDRLPRRIVAAASEAAATVAMPPFKVGFDRATSFSGRPGNVPFVLLGDDGVAGLSMFQQMLGTAMENAGLGHWVNRHYTPHMTLLYADRRVNEWIFIEAIDWTVREFVLVRSLIGRTRHIPIARWPLRG
jgi:RNA 2',3'-cyclic 3'-phosphodiesterase